MKIIRFLDTSGRERFGEPVGEHTARLIDGDIFGMFRVTEEE
ncbi:MAG: Rv2993c-like domain-containing protein, partial [Acidiferrobacterales bacterium]